MEDLNGNVCKYCGKSVLVRRYYYKGITWKYHYTRVMVAALSKMAYRNFMNLLSKLGFVVC
jgi:hypothetical protein